jgi:tetratricopeptide (TPR) repeat protein
MLAVIAMSVGLIGYSGPSAPRFEHCGTVRRDAASAPGDSACRALLQLVRAVQETDYKGHLDSLRQLHAAMVPFVDNAELAKHARYWRGFALWRRALNALGQGGSPDSTDADFARANEEFRHALRLDSAYAEAKIGLVAGLSNRVFFNQENSALRVALIREYRPLLEQLTQSDRDNPRFVFVAAPQRFHAPPEVGGSRTEAIAMVEAALARLAPSRADTIEAALEPTWGGPELHMLLAALLLRSRTQLDKAQLHAERALALRPDWLAVRRNLIPAIHALRAPGS